MKSDSISSYTKRLQGSDSKLSILKRLLLFRAFVLCSFILYTAYFFEQRISIITVSILTICTVLYSFITWLWYARGKPILDASLFTQLLWDSICILIFVYVLGRSTNPFIYYLLVVIAISASLLQERITWIFTGASIGSYSLFMYLDFNIHAAHMDDDFKAHLVGMWVNFSGSALLISFFISRLASALQQRERALGRAREEILKNEQLIGIGTLAASTVHSFGTPLSTISMAASEIKSTHNDLETHACIEMIDTQIDRCRTTMSKLSSLASHKSSPEQDISISELAIDIEEHFQLANVYPMPKISVSNMASNLSVPGGILLLHSVTNLIDNAVKAAKSKVDVHFETDNSIARIVIVDDGDGIDSNSYDVLGDRIVRSQSGLGIGILLANSTIEKLGGRVRFSELNISKAHSQPEDRTCVVVEIPLCDTISSTLNS